MPFTRIQHWFRSPLPCLAVGAFLACAGGILLLGIPGAVLFQIFTGGAVLKPDAAWPAAILVTLLWPWGMPAGYFIAARLLRAQKSSTVATFTVAVALAWIEGACLWVAHLGR